MKKRPSNPLPEDAPINSASSGSLPAPVLAGGWEARLVHYPYPSTDPLVTFPEKGLIIGLGNFGAAIIKGIYDRLDDVNALGENVLSRLAFIHLTMPDIGGIFADYGVNTQYVDEIVPHKRFPLQGPPLVLDAEALSAESWEWLQTLGGVRPNFTASGRAAARVILHNEIRFSASELITTLRSLGEGEPFTRVFIVTGADDPVGTQLIGDLAALIQLEWATGDNTEIYALIAAHSKDQVMGSAETWTAATIFETAALTSSIRLSWALPNHKVWNAANSERQLLNGVLLTRTTAYPQSLHEVEAVLWAFLTSDPQPNRSLMRDVTNKVKNPPAYIPRGHYLPTTSLFHAREVMFPLRFARELRTLQVMIAYVGQDNPPPAINTLGQDLSTGVGITAALEAARNSGLMTWLRAYSSLTKRDVSALLNELSTIRQSLQNRYRDQRAQLQRFLQITTPARLLPESIHDWLSEPVREDVLRELHYRAGFTVTNDRALVLWAGDQQYQLLTPESRRELHNFVTKPIEVLVRNLVVNVSQAGFAQLRDDYLSETLRLTEWGAKYIEWVKLLKAGTRNAPPDGMGWYHYSSIQLRAQNMTVSVDQTKVSSDKTQALQMTLFPRAGLAYLRFDTNVNPTTLRNSFVYSMQHIVSDVFNWKKNASIAYNLQAALTFLRPFKRFSQCCMNGTLSAQYMNSNGTPFLPFATARGNYEWEAILWRFIDLYVSNKQIEHIIDDLAAKTPVGSPILPEGVGFRDQLRQAIEKVVGANCPPYFNR